MEKKPLKRNENIVHLSKDHHFTLLFCWKIRQGVRMNVDPIRIRDYVDYFWKDHMIPHFHEEESILFAPVLNDRVDKAVEDHREIRDAIQALKTAEGEYLTKQLTALADRVDAHVRYEERELFPWLETVLSEDQLIKIGAVLALEPSVPDDYADAFWIK